MWNCSSIGVTRFSRPPSPHPKSAQVSGRNLLKEGKKGKREEVSYESVRIACTAFHYSTRSTTIHWMSQTPDFETALKKLEEIVKKLETGELSLESALALFGEGIKLSRFCHTKLEEAERRVEILLKNDSGQMRAVPLETENESQIRNEH